MSSVLKTLAGILLWDVCETFFSSGCVTRTLTRRRRTAEQTLMHISYCQLCLVMRNVYRIVIIRWYFTKDGHIKYNQTNCISNSNWYTCVLIDSITISNMLRRGQQLPKQFTKRPAYQWEDSHLHINQCTSWIDMSIANTYHVERHGLAEVEQYRSYLFVWIFRKYIIVQ